MIKKHTLYIDISTSSIIGAYKLGHELKLITNIPHNAFHDQKIDWTMLKKALQSLLEKAITKKNHFQATYVSLPFEKNFYQLLNMNLQMLPLQETDFQNMYMYLWKKMLKKGYVTLHFISTESKIDDIVQSNPIGIPGKKLSIKFHMICVAASLVSFIENILAYYGIDPIFTNRLHVISSSLIPKQALNKGTLLIDFGQNRTTFEIIQNDKSLSLDSIPIGDRHIVNDIAYVLNIEKKEAVHLKLKKGRILTTFPKDVSKTSHEEYISAIMTARMEEILKKIHDEVGSFLELAKIQYIFITGSGLTNLGIDQYVEQFFHIETYSIRFPHIQDTALPGYFLAPILAMNNKIPRDTFIKNKKSVKNTTTSVQTIIEWLKDNF